MLDSTTGDSTMTTELQRAMAQYEEGRIQYRKTLLASLDGAADGDAIRLAIENFQKASTELRCLQQLQIGPLPAPTEPREVPVSLRAAGLMLTRFVLGLFMICHVRVPLNGGFEIVDPELPSQRQLPGAPLPPKSLPRSQLA
jgi:hypothetical protein